MTINGPLLVVEDEENDVFFLKRAMQRAGILNPLYSVANGQAATDYLSGAGAFADRTRFPLPFLVLLDLKLPCIGGIEVLRWIRARPELRNLLVVVLTSSTLPADIADAYSAGANSYIVKPGDPELLADSMRDFAKWWLKRNVPPP